MTRAEEIEKMYNSLSHTPMKDVSLYEHYVANIVSLYGLSLREAQSYAKDIIAHKGR